MTILREQEGDHPLARTYIYTVDATPFEAMEIRNSYQKNQSGVLSEALFYMSNLRMIVRVHGGCLYDGLLYMMSC